MFAVSKHKKKRKSGKHNAATNQKPFRHEPPRQKKMTLQHDNENNFLLWMYPKQHKDHNMPERLKQTTTVTSSQQLPY